MKITICNTPYELGKEASGLAATRLRDAIRTKGEARLVLSTGVSQLETLDSLLKEKIEWGRIEIFHLDEYIGLPSVHKACFRRYLAERFIKWIDCRKFHSIDTEEESRKLIGRLTHEIREKPVDVGLIGIGENAHIAFNDPPADFKTSDSFKIVTLDERCRSQQLGEGWFSDLNEVPEKAISMSVYQIMQCVTIISAVPFRIKAEAVSKTLRNNVDPMIPASILKSHDDFNLFLDRDSASGIIPV
jgi:glucosamine-6-phosphate deaminase